MKHILWIRNHRKLEFLFCSTSNPIVLQRKMVIVHIAFFFRFFLFFSSPSLNELLYAINIYMYLLVSN